VKVIIAIAICKILYFIGRLVGKGSSLPGQIALKFYPEVLNRLKLPPTIIAITGSNGKTSTAETVAYALKGNGKSVGWNHEGSNQIEGAATLLLRLSSISGAIKKDAIVLECDERYATKIFKQIRPTVLAVTNLCRDQLTRNGHHEFIRDCISEAIAAAGAETKLVLNADDPYVASLVSDKTENEIIWFGVGKEVFYRTPPGEAMASKCINAAGMYDDGAFCPICKGKMTYNYRITGHFGDYMCNLCGFMRQRPSIEVTKLDYSTGDVTIIAREKPVTKHTMPPDTNHIPEETPVVAHMAHVSLTGTYNLLTTIAAVSAAGIAASDTVKTLDKYELKGGRTVRFLVGDREGMLLISKHENSLSYNQSLSWAVQQSKPCTVVILVDSISRKYFTSETSWLWDISFDILSDDKVKNIVLSGRYVSELASRFALSCIDKQKIAYVNELDKMREFVESSTIGTIYAVTCFSDKLKLQKALGILRK